MAAPYYPKGVRPILTASTSVAGLGVRLGHMLTFFSRAVAGFPLAVTRYRKAFLTILSDVTWGNGSIVVGGGTAWVIILLGATAGAIVGIEGYQALHLLGMEPAAGLLSSTVSTRELAPVMAALAFAAQAGCRFTAQLGSMRISEEIDAIESLAIRPLPYLVSTRLLASVVAIIPLYILCLVVNYAAVQSIVTFAGGLSAGSFEHYFRLVLTGQDIVYSVIKAIVFVIITSTIQCYYGYFAAGGPQGVGIAAGRAMRASISVMIIANLLLTIGLWGIGSGARLGG
ncbi:ABC transporter permease [Mycolicibacterium novocastrense]|uniref:ABC transporter permease n=1 Tax=Mycobacteriaceae TaxID=1762 RepID=UPI0007475C01|nr:MULTISPECIES: ABC transporter permease [Mycobacteriaceae]KUH70765.1 ABC transporter permease [Mycolicibacterium novocastrense]KUH71695.1 ABC transporter permease [Mycolicibacterium novocastrense]KUH72084.1 ABC transporter permease [Mycolicibacterium novocastrense]KUI46821.1 ABC transporter permease [Mycobacterium sp. GA-1199]UUO03540.1 ABC transporter permease [Mycolicibacterium novocastrense]